MSCISTQAGSALVNRPQEARRLLKTVGLISCQAKIPRDAERFKRKPQACNAILTLGRPLLIIAQLLGKMPSYLDLPQ